MRECNFEIINLSIIAHGKNTLVKLSFSICNHRLFFTPTISSFLQTSDKNCNTSIMQLQTNFLNSPIKFVWKNIETNSRWKLEIDDITVVNSIVMTICIPPFSKPRLDFDFTPKWSIPTYIPYCKSYSYISMWWIHPKVIVVKANLFSKSQCKYM